MISPPRLAYQVGALFETVNPYCRAFLLSYWWGQEKEGSSSGLGTVRSRTFIPIIVQPVLVIPFWLKEFHKEHIPNSTCQRPGHIILKPETIQERGTTWNLHGM